MSVYDGQWSISLSNYDPAILNATESGVFIGNGKIGALTGFDGQLQKTMITSQIKYTNGVYKANIIEPFSVDRVSFNTPKTMISQSLNMYNAVFTSKYTIGGASVETDVYAPQQLPFCLVTTVKLTPQQNTPSLVFFHEVVANDNLVQPEFNNNVIFNEDIQADKGIYVLSGKAHLRTDLDQVVASASIYVFETQLTADNLGFNIPRSNINQAFNRFRLKNLEAGTEYKFHIISAILTSFDFESPVEEAKRIVLNITNKAATPPASAQLVRAEHTTAWAKMWETDLTITPKTGITSQEQAELTALKRQLRYSLYNVYSSVREGINLEVNPLNLSIIDYDGSVLYNGDLFLMPILIMIKPDVARALLEHRYKALNVAKQLAAGYGFKGAKYPYNNDSIGYKNALYWDTVGPMSLFNTCLIAINTWNYYRVSRDLDWLGSIGYQVLKEIADFISSKATAGVDGVYRLDAVISLNGVSEDQNAFTNNMAKLALRYAIEASYELSYRVKDVWQAVYYGLPILTFAYPNQYRIRANEDDGPSIMYDIIDAAFILAPYYDQVFLQADTGRRIETTFVDNKQYYAGKISEADHPFNSSIMAVLNGLIAQYNPNIVSDFKTTLYAFLEDNTSGVWKHLYYHGGQTDMPQNDVNLNAILLFMITQGIMQLHPMGGVAETRFYYEELRLDALTSANMPNTWKTVKMSKTGVDGQTFITTNSIYYVACND